MKFIFILFLNNILFIYSTYNNPETLPSNYPFSYKKSDSISIIFMENSITLFDVTKTIDYLNPLEEHILIDNCISREEKGGIFLNNYYYTSCLKNDDLNKFQIKVYDLDFNLQNIFPSNIDYYSFSSGTIRFFIKNTDPEIVGITWINNGEFNMAKINPIIIKQYRHYPVSNMARDTDCIFIKKHSRIVCLFGIEINEKITCSVNIFTYNDSDDNIFTSNLKTWYVCTSHQSRKIRGDTDRNEDSEMFYYYFVDTNHDAYIIQMQLINPVSIDIGPVLKVMKGCDENQHSFDMAEDKFMGYNVLICVEYRFKKKIKIQLFKIEDNQIIFYENRDVDNPYEFYDEFNSEISMINFIVLKDTLNFGFLSYRTMEKPTDYYTIFNQPECINYEISMMTEDLYQNKFIELDFNGVIKNDNYAGGKIEIVNINPGMEVSVLESGTDVKFTSKNYITGELEFIFKVRNYFYASEPCIANIEVKDCYKNCKTCTIKGAIFFSQLCEGCKDGNYYPIVDFPKTINDNCCEKDVDCPSYLYLNVDRYEICDIPCLECNGGNDYKCITCYNTHELQKYSIMEQTYINEIKHDTTSLWFYWENEEHKRCVNRDNELYIYLDEDTWTYMPCYKSCEQCEGKGIPTNHHCIRCYENSDYFHFENIDSENCFRENEVPHNYFKFVDSYIPGEIDQSRFWKKCYDLCYSCIGGNNDDCTSCVIGSYPKCEEKNLYNYECFDDYPDTNYFFNINNNCYEKCDPNCLTCDKGRDNSINNCISCNFGQILFNRNCYDNCPETHFELEHKMCVLQCPDYAPTKLTNIGKNNEYNQCYNCAEIGKCVYLGTKKADPFLKGDCISCNLAETFLSNEDYGILDDCYDLCELCSERGTPSKMNCISCKNPLHCLVKNYGNCVEDGTEIDFYYRDIEAGKCVYNKCYETCKRCSGNGNNINHNCLLCKDNLQFDLNNPGNCVELCQQLWYINPDTFIITCINDQICPDTYPYLVKLTKECVTHCSLAFNTGPNLLYKFKNYCLAQCPDNTMRDDLLYSCYPLDDVQDVFNFATNYISPNEYVNNLLIYNTEKKQYFHLFNTTEKGLKTYKTISNNVGTSIIDFSNCISTLKQIYGYNDDEIYYIGILDIIRDDTSSPQIEYIIHNHLGIKLNNDNCINNEISINKSLLHNNDTFLAKDTLEKYNIDITYYNSENKFFCDICTIFEYNKFDPYDVLLNDRYNYYYKTPEYKFCENGCNSKLTKIDLNNYRVTCICKGKSNFITIKKDDFQKFDKISQICSDWFMQYLKCYQNVFSKDLLRNNIGNLFIFFFILFQILSLLLFFLISKKPIIKSIREVLLKKSKQIYQDQDENLEVEKEILQISKNGSKNNSLNKTNSKNSKNNNKINSKNNSEKNSKNSKINIEKESKNENKSEGKNSHKTGNTRKSLSQNNSSKNSDNHSGYYTESKNSNANPPKNENDKNSIISDDNQNDNNNNKKKNIYNLNINRNNKDTKKTNNTNNYDNKNEEIKKNNKIENKGAPKTLFQRYAKRFLQNRKDYIDDSYREDSYNFDLSKLSKDKKKKKEEEYNEEENTENEEKEENEDNKNNENENDKDNNNNKEGDGDNKSTKKGGKKKELSPEEQLKKEKLEKFKEEIHKFKKLTFIELYWFILKKRHRIISLFVKKDIYDIFSIKFSLLILSYTIDFFITTFLFFDFEIRSIFHRKQHIDPYYIIFMGLIDILISTCLMRVIDYFMEFRKKFKNLEREKKFDKKNYFNILTKIIKDLNKKIIIYYVITFVFSLIVWYIVSAFFGTYPNVKINLLIMIGMNFCLSIIFPFIYYLIMVLLQYKGIHKKKYKLYKFAMLTLKI